MSYIYPESAQFDMISEIENIIWAMIKLVVFTSMTWVAIRIVFPKVYTFMNEDHRRNYDEMSVEHKRVLSIAIFFAFLLSLVLLS